MMHSKVRAAARLSLFLLITSGLLPFYLLSYPFGRGARRAMSWPFYRACIALTGLSLRVSGTQAGPGTFFVANHISYLDIPVIAVLVDGLFVAKAEVQSWPLFGFLARITRTVFVSRNMSKVAKERLKIAGSLADGESVILFPEGSSSDGSRLLPFRPGLLSAAKAASDLSVRVQPVTITYGPAGKTGNAFTQQDRDRYAWYGDMELASHLWGVFGLKQGAIVSVHFHAPRTSDEFKDARALAAWAEKTVSERIRRQLGAATEMPEKTSIPTYDAGALKTSAP